MKPILQIRGLTKKYGGLTANNNISFDVAEGEILSVIGPNGAGKSTLFKLIASFVHATSGEVLFRGEDISRADQRQPDHGASEHAGQHPAPGLPTCHRALHRLTAHQDSHINLRTCRHGQQNPWKNGTSRCQHVLM